MCEIKVGCSMQPTAIVEFIRRSTHLSIIHYTCAVISQTVIFGWFLGGGAVRWGLVQTNRISRPLKLVLNAKTLPPNTHQIHYIYKYRQKANVIEWTLYMYLYKYIYIYIDIGMMFHKPLWTSLPSCTNVWFKRDMCYHFNICRVVSRRWPTHVLRKRCPNITGCIDK